MTFSLPSPPKITFSPETPKWVAHPALYKLGAFGWVLILLGLLGGKSLQNIGMVLLLIAVLGERRAFYAYMRHDPLFKAVAVWSVYVAARTLWAAVEFPGTNQLHEGLGMLRVIFIVIGAAWIGGQFKTLLTVYRLALIGLFATLLLRVQWLHLDSLLHNDPGALGIHHSNVGFLLAVALTGWVIFAQEITGLSAARPWIGRGVWVAVLIVLFQWILLSQLRIIWVALLAWGLFMLLHVVLTGYNASKTREPVKQAFVMASVMLLCTGLVATQFNMVSARLSQEDTVVTKVLERDFSDIPATSFGIRIYLWKIGLEAARARILFGWGPGTTPMLIQQSPFSEPIQNALSLHTHLHNTYLELMVRLGLVGFALMGIILFLIIRAARRVAHESPLYEKISTFSMTALFLLGIAGLTDNYMRQIGWFSLSLIGFVYTFVLESDHKQRGSSGSCLGKALPPLHPILTPALSLKEREERN